MTDGYFDIYKFHRAVGNADGTISAAALVDVGRFLGPDVPVSVGGDDPRLEPYVRLGQSQYGKSLNGHAGGYVDAFGGWHQTFCMSCHDHSATGGFLNVTANNTVNSSWTVFLVRDVAPLALSMGQMAWAKLATSTAVSAEAIALEGTDTELLESLSSEMEHAPGKLRAAEGVPNLRDAALDVHNAIRETNPIRFGKSAVAVHAVETPAGIEIRAATSAGRFDAQQLGMLDQLGIKAVQQPYRAGVHAEDILLNALQPDEAVRGWGISWGGRQLPLPCWKCNPKVNTAGGWIDFFGAKE